MKIVITIPAYNEAKTIANVIAKIKNELKDYKDTKILVVNDGSNDNTEQVAKKAGAIVYSHPLNYGLAKTFKTEMQQCLKLNPDIIVHIDADGQYLASDITKLLKPIIAKQADLVLGSRFKGKIESMSFMKKIGNRAFSKVISSITRKKISDAQTGFRAFTKEVALLEIVSDYTYTQEQIIRAVNAKLTIKEVPVFFAKRDDKSRLMKNPFDYAIKAWVNLLRMKTMDWGENVIDLDECEKRMNIHTIDKCLKSCSCEPCNFTPDKNKGVEKDE